MSSNKRTSKVKNGILFAVVIAFLIAIIGSTYSRYVSNGRVDSAGEIAKWNIKLGEQDISSEAKTIDVNLTADEESNENVTAGKLAPGQKLSGTFKVDPTGSEVAVDYLLSIGSVQVSGGTWNEGSELSLSKVTVLLEDETNATELTIAEGGTTYFENLTDVLNGKDVTFKIYVTWENNEDANNDADTKNGVSVTQITIPVTVVVRQHIAEFYTVTFKDGETELSAQTVKEGDTATKPTDPTKYGFEFVNWYSDSEFTTEYDFASIINGDTTIYAKWETITYDITYDLAGGTVAGSNPSTYTIETNEITLSNPTRTGYTFTGWTGTGLGSKATTVRIPKGSMGNRTYTANWELTTYSVTYNNDNGANSGNLHSYTMNTDSFSLNRPSKVGYAFMGWTGTGLNSRSMLVNVPKGSIGNREYTANWQQQTTSYPGTKTINGTMPSTVLSQTVAMDQNLKTYTAGLCSEDITRNLVVLTTYPEPVKASYSSNAGWCNESTGSLVTGGYYGTDGGIGWTALSRSANKSTMTTYYHIVLESGAVVEFRFEAYKYTYNIIWR